MYKEEIHPKNVFFFVNFAGKMHGLRRGRVVVCMSGVDKRCVSHPWHVCLWRVAWKWVNWDECITRPPCRLSACTPGRPPAMSCPSSSMTPLRSPEDKLRLQEQVLRLRADVGREHVENASVTERLAQAEARVGGVSLFFKLGVGGREAGGVLMSCSVVFMHGGGRTVQYDHIPSDPYNKGSGWSTSGFSPTRQTL